MKLIALLFMLWLPTAYAESVILCDVSQGLKLIDQDSYSLRQIDMILQSCDKVSPNDPDVLLLHGLLAQKSKQNNIAIAWFERAHTMAPDNIPIVLTLAAAYSSDHQFEKASLWYQYILAKNALNRAALLGQANVFRLEKSFDKAITIYQTLLAVYAKDPDALNGLGWVKIEQNDLVSAKLFFHQTLAIEPANVEALAALGKIKQTESGSSDLCDTKKGLLLLGEQQPPISQIRAILTHCAFNRIENKDTYLLEGLLARQQKDYKAAVNWLEKSIHVAQQDDGPILALAATYEWANKPLDAQVIYQKMLAADPHSKPAQLGQARVLRLLKKWSLAEAIYRQLLAHNPTDIDAINGLGWIALAEKNPTLAIQYFQRSLTIEPTNQEARQGIKDTEKPAFKPSLCDADEGLILLNQKNPPLKKIESILIRCDKHEPGSPSRLLLRGLLARFFAKNTHCSYEDAITWLSMAMQTAPSGDDGPALELGYTFELAREYKQAIAIYGMLLDKNPHNRHALLGLARAYRFAFQIEPALAIYQDMLAQKPNDTDALTGIGETYLVNYDFCEARKALHKALTLNPKNKDAVESMAVLDHATRNILELVGGNYRVAPNTSNGINLFYFRNLNATDSLSVLGMHNTRQIESGFGTSPTLLPNNGLLLGYQRLIPNKYSWQLSYDARQHNGLPFENRFFAGGSFYIRRNIEWFGDLRLITPDIWTTQLFISGLNIYTPLPMNFTVAGFWSFQQVEGYNSTYVFDVFKEYPNHFLYAFGPSYLPEQKSWEVHARFIVPIFNNQALVFQGSHYMFNSSTFINAGWRVYWA